MIKLLKLQKAVLVILVGVIMFVIYKIEDNHRVVGSKYFLYSSGALMMIGALWLLYPILFAKKDKDGNAEITTDPTVTYANEADENKVTD